jgi:hypothetical protein
MVWSQARWFGDGPRHAGPGHVSAARGQANRFVKIIKFGNVIGALARVAQHPHRAFGSALIYPTLWAVNETSFEW